MPSRSACGSRRSAGIGPPNRDPAPWESQACFLTSLNQYVRRRRTFSQENLGVCARPAGSPHLPTSRHPPEHAKRRDSRRAGAALPSHSAPPSGCAAARRWHGRGRRRLEPRTAPAWHPAARDHFDADARDTRADHFQFARGGVGKVDDPPADKGTAVGNAHLGGPVVVEIVDFYPRIEREGAVGCRHLLHVVNFAIRGSAAVVGMAVPTGDTLLGVARMTTTGVRGDAARA